MGVSLTEALSRWPFDLNADQILALTPIVEAARNRGETIRFWCIVHRSPGEWEMNRGATDELRCWWDQLAGPRPGRGQCQFKEATVIAK